MAKEWAIKFYSTKKWKVFREAYFRDKFGMCELCERPGEEVHHEIFLTAKNIDDPNITLNADNCILLCKKCHNIQHNKAYNLHKEKIRKMETTRRDLCFDESGNLIQRKNVFIVYGAPCSGKTTYIREHKGEHDIVFDLDYVISALSLGTVKKAEDNDCVDFALKIRKYFYELIECRELFFENVWISAGLYDKHERDNLAIKLKAELIHIDTDIEECKRRAKLDEDREDKRKQYKIIDYYFDNLT